MARKVNFFNPPHLYCVTTLPRKTNTTANIGVKCQVNGNTTVATSWCRSEYLVRGRQGWSSSILERKL